MLTVIWYEVYPFKYYLNCGSVNVLAKKEKKILVIMHHVNSVKLYVKEGSSFLWRNSCKFVTALIPLISDLT